MTQSSNFFECLACAARADDTTAEPIKKEKREFRGNSSHFSFESFYHHHKLCAGISIELTAKGFLLFRLLYSESIQSEQKVSG
jgi:hypothetical protein